MRGLRVFDHMHSHPPTQKQKFNDKSKLITYPRFFFILTFFFVLLILFSKTTSADVVSINSGGNGEIVVNPNTYIEGFFSGIPAAVSVCGNGIVESGEQCDNGASNGACPATCSASCTVNSCGGVGGGGGGGAAANITLVPDNFNINLAVNTTTERTIRITNTGGNTLTVFAFQSLGNHVILGSNNLTIAPGQTASLNVIFIALSEPGIFTGTINIGGKSVLVSLNVKTKLLLFDSNIVVLNKDYKVSQGDQLKTRVTLIPLGDQERLDVGLFFTIRDYTGKIYLTKSETLLVEKLSSLDRNFDTGSLPVGKYIIGLELRYPNGVAPSSAYFEVTQKKKASIIGRIILFLVSLILITLIIIILILIWRRRKKKEEEGEGAETE